MDFSFRSPRCFDSNFANSSTVITSEIPKPSLFCQWSYFSSPWQMMCVLVTVLLERYPRFSLVACSTTTSMVPLITGSDTLVSALIMATSSSTLTLSFEITSFPSSISVRGLATKITSFSSCWTSWLLFNPNRLGSADGDVEVSALPTPWGKTSN